MTAILLAGRGSAPQDFAEELVDSKTSADRSLPEHFPGCKWVILGGPDRKTLSGVQPEWFSLASTSFPHAEPARQIEGLRESILYVRLAVAMECAEIPRARLVLGGISQGFAVAAHVFLSGAQDMGAFVGCSGWLPFVDDVCRVGVAEVHAKIGLPVDVNHDKRATTPILLMHSADDDVVEVDHGRSAAQTFRKVLGPRVEYVEFRDGGHEICEPKGWGAIKARLDCV